MYLMNLRNTYPHIAIIPIQKIEAQKRVAKCNPLV
jgi:hypothetical protein